MPKIIFQSPISEQINLSISFSCNDTANIITGVRYCQKENDDGQAPESFNSNELTFIQEIKNELESYFNDGKYHFSLSCDFPSGTPFQQRVWKALTQIPPGEVKTYGELAKELNSSARAVGNACRCNLFPVIIPCHRIISAAGIGGYAGDTLKTQRGQIHFLQIKQWLLTHESVELER